MDGVDANDPARCRANPAVQEDLGHMLWAALWSSWSLAAETVHIGTETRSLAVRFPPPTGVVFRLRDAKGRRLYDADVVLLLPPGEAGGPNLDRLTALQANQEGGLDVAHAVPPGVYRYVVAKGGCGRSTGEVRVVSGQLRRITCVLRP